MRLLIVYKFVKAALVLSLAAVITFDEPHPEGVVRKLTQQLVDRRQLPAPMGEWVQAHITGSIVTKGRILAWLDGTSTAIEGTLLLLGKSWAEWVVAGAMGSLIPFELVSLLHGFTPVKLAILVVNVIVVAYLVWRRLRHANGTT